MNGGKIFIDSSIVVQHYPRETLSKFYKLCFNYGVGRGLFIMKHKVFSAYRQLAPPISLIAAISLLGFGLIYPSAIDLLAGLFALYLLLILVMAVSISKNIRQLIMACMGFVGCHVCWTAGLLISPYIYKRDLVRNF
jgi:hypothetical protein